MPVERAAIGHCLLLTAVVNYMLNELVVRRVLGLTILEHAI